MTQSEKVPVPPPGPGRRHQLTLLFADLCSSTRMAGLMEAELYAQLLGDIRAIYHDVTEQFGGSAVRVQGDGLLAVFGYPQPGERDAERATQAALEMHRQVQALQPPVLLPADLPLGLHSGVHTGQVLVSEGNSASGWLQLDGDPVNLAARLSDLARHGDVLVSADSLGPARQGFCFASEEQVMVRGRDERLGVLRIRARQPVKLRRLEVFQRRGQAPFVGRKSELRQLEQALERVSTGRSERVLLLAPPGLGKTRLAEEFLREASRRAQVHRGYCEDEFGAEPLQALAQMLRALVGQGHQTPAADCVAQLQTQIGPLELASQQALMGLLNPGMFTADPEQASAQLHVLAQALRQVLTPLAQQHPQILFVDDWQWSDEATRRVLADLLSLPGPGLLLLLTVRETDGLSDTPSAWDGPVTLLRLPPLTSADVSQAVSELLSGLDPFQIRQVSDNTGGNPLYIEEMCHNLLATEGHGSDLPPNLASPVWLNNLIMSRVARLRPTLLEVLRTAAAIGRVVPVWLLKALTGCEADDPRLQELDQLDFLFPGEVAGTLRFKHELTRSVIYKDIGLHQVRVLHQRIANELHHQAEGAGRDQHEALAYHHHAGNQSNEAAHHAVLAGDRALAVSALDRAQQLYQLALTTLDKLVPSPTMYRRWMTVVGKLGLVSVFAPSRSSLEVFRRAVQRAASHDDSRSLAQAEYWLGYVHYALGDIDEAIHHCQVALEVARLFDNPRLVVQIRATLGQAHASAGHHQQALVLLDEAIATKRMHRKPGRPAVGLSYSLACRAMVLGDLGQFDAAHASFDEALAVVQGAQHEVEASVLGWRSAVYLWQGRWSDARQAARQAGQIAERVKSLYIYSMDQALAAYAQWQLASDATTLKTLADATQWLDRRGRRLNLSLNHGWLADALVTHIGQQASDHCHDADVRGHVAKALRRWRHHDPLGGVMALRALARLHQLRQRPQQAQRTMARAVRLAEQRGSPPALAVTRWQAAELAAAQGEAHHACTLLDAAEEAFVQMAMHWHQAQARALRARLVPPLRG